MDSTKKYQPISCVYYDLIEHYAIRKEIISIVMHSENENQESFKTRILDTKAKDGVEYILLENPKEWFRMDRIVSLNDDLLSDFLSCTRLAHY